VTRRFLFTTWPFPGHLLPMLSIAIELRGRGHEVAFYSGESARETIEQAGFPLFPFERLSDERVRRTLSVVDDAGRRVRGRRLARMLRDWLVETIPGQVADLRAVLAEWPADAIFTDVSMWGPMLVLWEAEKIPVALAARTMGPMIPGPDTPAFGFGFGPPRTRRGRLAAAALTRIGETLALPLRRRVNELRRGEGLPPLQESVMRYSAHLPLYIVGNIRALDFDRRDLPESVHYVGNCAWYPDGDTGEQWLDGITTERPWVHVTESTMASGDPFLLRTAIAALADEPVEVIITTGEQRDIDLLGGGPRPANVHIARWLSHGALLARCSALVTLGGKSTVLAAAEAGVPVVLVPTTWDKPDNARRVTEAGAGIRLSARKLDAEQLRAAVRQVLYEPRYREAARRLADGLAAAPGPPRAAELLERLVSDKAPPPPARARPARGGVSVRAHQIERISS
jgi:MGT family glycosyltransferase